MAHSTSTTAPRTLLRAEAIALMLGCSRKKVYDLVATAMPGFNRPLPAVRFGLRGLRFDPEQVWEWVREHAK